MLDCCLFILSKFKFSLDLHYSKYCVIYHTNTYVRRRGQTYHNIIIHIIKRFSSCAAKQTNKHTHTRTHAHTHTHGHTHTQAHMDRHIHRHTTVLVLTSQLTNFHLQISQMWKSLKILPSQRAAVHLPTRLLDTATARDGLGLVRVIIVISQKFSTFNSYKKFPAFETASRSSFQISCLLSSWSTTASKIVDSLPSLNTYNFAI